MNGEGISPEEAEALRAQCPGGRDFLALSELEVANLLMRLGEARVSRSAAFHRAKSLRKVTTLAQNLALRLDGMGEAERAELSAALRRSAEEA